MVDLAAIQIPEISPEEIGIRVVHDGGSRGRHESQEEVDVVHRDAVTREIGGRGERARWERGDFQMSARKVTLTDGLQRFLSRPRDIYMLG